MRRGRRNRGDSIAEVEFPETDREQLDSLIDYLAELLAEERLQELEQREEEKP